MLRRILTLLLLTTSVGCATFSHSPSNPNLNVGKVLTVDIQNGQMNIPGTGLVNIRPVHFTVSYNHCQQAQIFATQNNLSRNIQACYYQNALFLDAKKLGNRQTQGAIRFNAIPLWQQGFIYRNVNSFGYTQLANANIRIQSQ